MFNDAPFITLPAKYRSGSCSGVFVFCDHATNHIPAVYNNLGLSDADLSRHIAWDIGAETLTRLFCKTFGAAGLLAGFSRLLIDPNRAVGQAGSIPLISDNTPIPGNQNLSDADIKTRIEHLYGPYHQALEDALDAAQSRHVDPLIISIHSFTPEMASGQKRDLDIGLLWKADPDKAERIKAAIEQVHPYKVELNQPYSALELNYTMDRHVIARGLRHTTLEVRQDLIDTEAKALVVAKRLTEALNSFIRD
ncbi:MAG: N-formylglutamate amidohydrolase [Robiginitomaculum sp.]|nr:N-formylglutamate amidohydrolase [Robiginitomaculum sp.]